MPSPRLRRDCLRRRRADGRRDRAGSRRPQPSLRRPRVPRSRDADRSRDAAAAGTDRQGLGRCRRAVAREGVRSRRQPRLRRGGGHRHVRAVRHGLRLPLRGVERSGVQGGGARLLLRPRAREPDLPVEHLPLQRPGHRLQRPGRRAGGLLRVLQPRRREDDPGARLVVTHLVSSRRRGARARRDAVRRSTGAGRPDARDRSRSPAGGVPAGTLRQVRPGRLVWNDATGSIGGIRSLRLRQRGRRSVFFRLRTVPLGLSAADRVDHFIEVSLRAGTAAVTTTPLWHFDGKALVTRD